MSVILLFALFAMTAAVLGVAIKRQWLVVVDRDDPEGPTTLPAMPKWAWVTLLVSVAMAALIVMIEEPEVIPALFMLGAILAIALFIKSWAHEFLFLMSLEEEDLPGRFDKAIWAFTMLVVPPVGLWTFRVYRQARWPEVASKPAPSVDLP